MVLEANEIPAATRVECGNYKDLSLFGAKEYAKEALENTLLNKIQFCIPLEINQLYHLKFLLNK